MSSALLFPFKALLVALDLTITFVTFGWVGAVKKALKKEGLRSLPVGDDESHRVKTEYKGNLSTTPREGVYTMYELCDGSFTKFGSKPCMEVRKFLGWKSPKVKHFADDIQSWTYSEVGEISYKFGAALRKEGLVSSPDVATLDKISTPCTLAIFENSCPQWVMAAIGAFSQSFIVTTIYATLGMDAVVDAINDVSISAILCNKLNLAKLEERIKEVPTLKLIVYTNDTVAPDDTTPIPDIAGVKIISFEDFVALGNTTAFPPVPPKPDACAVIMYTSGSTGKAKGVVLSHRMILATVSGWIIILGLRPEDKYLSYLPLAHILEMTAEFTILTAGCRLCYADPKSLSTTGAYPIGALEQFKPSLMPAVPKIWDVIKKGIEAKVALSSPVAQFLVKTAFQARSFALHHGFDTPLFKALVFKKFNKVVGGNLRFAISGGGPLNGEVHEFIRTCFGAPLVQGYGLTETCSGLTVQSFSDLRNGIAGVPIPCVECKLVSTPDVADKAGKPYLTSDRVDVEGNAILGRGEILAKGANISLGYYMLPDKTKEVFQEDGFFQTGDIGQYMADGSIRIVDRKKNLVKLKGGEYIALERMEMVYGNSSFVDAINGGICCYGDGDMDRPVALMQLNEPVAMKWAKANGVEGDFEAVKQSSGLMGAVMADFMGEHKKGGLSPLEKLKAVAFVGEPWTPDNGCLTAANKLQRKTVVSMFDKEFQEVRKKGIF